MTERKHATDCSDGDTAGIEDQPQSDNERRFRRREKKAKVCYLGLSSMYDDIEYSKDDFDMRSIHGREYAVCMTTLSIVKTTLICVVYTKGNTPYV